ncbi:hypothetical protein GGD41_003810 [Paraburkholderia bryophila]|uniref:Uncharacterized protein n=1 Tax=Paraburkholderia bryophila TaxID=420952 RepID=A0A7Z0B1N5_9BURK|nr:hypothetical protein [Paraburkholderia bryophila]
MRASFCASRKWWASAALEAAAERGALHHRDRNRAGVEAARGRMHAIHTGTRVGHQRLALARADRLGEEIEIAADVVHGRNQRPGHPEIDLQSRLSRRLREAQNVMHQIEVETGTRLRSQHHPHDITAFLIVSGDLRQVAGFDERTAGVVAMQIHFERSFKVKHW